MLAVACANATIFPRHNTFARWNRSTLVTPKTFLVGTLISLERHRTQCSTSTPWLTDLSTSLYKIDGWGAPYFHINKPGNISVRPHGTSTLPHEEIELIKVVQEATGSKASGGVGLQMPLIIRFPEVLKHRLESLNGAFEFAIQDNEYESHYQGVYPVKCNQDRYIVEDLVEFGAPFRFGLEAGSKAELLLAMSYLVKGNQAAFLICNGYKDEEYVSLAIIAHTMGLNTVIVLEQEEELDMIIETSTRLGVRPIIGLRAKLRTKHSGHFGSTSGENGKFGLTTAQILCVVSKLKQLEMLDCLQLLHFHIGSQIPSIALLAEGVREASQIYCELVRLGASMRTIDVGGGVGVDYDGTHSCGFDISVGYGLDEYATTVVQTIRLACDQKGVKHPILCSESGRALVSHHSVLIFEAFSSSQPISFELERNLIHHLGQLTENAQADYPNLMEAVMNADNDTCNIYADQLKKSSVEQFKDGIIGLEHLAAVDEFCNLVARKSGVPKPIQAYNVNLSLFTSIPDFWAIGQLFPILPIHRLTERPGVNGMLLDLSCDSDGKINRFITDQSTLPLHEINSNSGCKEAFYLGMFLGGAYQEALGGIHNLFGGPSVVRVSQSDGPHNFAITQGLPGPSCADMLRAMNHDPERMFNSIKHRIEEYGLGSFKTCAISNAFESMPYLVFGTNIGGDGKTSDSEVSSVVIEEGSGFKDEEEPELACEERTPVLYKEMEGILF